MRLVVFILMALFALAALAASNHAKPILAVEDHSSGGWQFNQADYPACVTVHNAPLEHPHGTNLYPRRSDTA